MIAADLEQFSLTVLLVTFVGGIVTGSNPCCFMLFPAVCGYLCGYSVPSFKRCLLLSSLFALGVATATAFVGLIATLLGGFFGDLPTPFRYLLPFVPIVMGLNLLGVFNFTFPGLTDWKPVRTGALGAYLTGLLFSLVILPCATPILASVLSVAASNGRLLYGTTLLFVYGLGIGVPLVIVGTSIGLVSRFKTIERHWPLVNKISGVILIILGLYLFWLA